MNNLSRYDGRGIDPPYLTDTDETEQNAIERCAVIAETMEFRMEISEWQRMTKKQISERVAQDIAEAIRNQ